MPSVKYDDLGAISGVNLNPAIDLYPTKYPGSLRSRDRNDKQRLAFECDPNRPFTGIVHIQASVGDPTKQDEDVLWFDVAEMVINNEGGTWSYEPQGEFSSVRVVCKVGNYWTAANANLSNATVVTGGDFTVDGITVSVALGSDATAVASAINATPGIAAANIVADVITDNVVANALRIYKTDGTQLVLADTVGTPLADMGISSTTYRPGTISKIRMLR